MSGDASLSYEELLRTCEELRRTAARAISTKQELIETKQALDAELERYRQIQRYIERALPLVELDAFAALTAEALVEAFDLEAALFVLAGEAGVGRVVGACGLSACPPELPLAPAWIAAQAITLHRPGSPVVSAWAALAASDALICPLHDAQGRGQGALIGLRTSDGARFYPDLPSSASVGVLAHQAGALLRSMQAREVIQRQVVELREALRVRQIVEEERRAEERRALRQQEIIALQRETLRQLETPVLPIAAGVLAVPLIGAIDRERAALLQAALLTAVQAQRARRVIVDVTGVRAVDEEVVGLLVGMTRAVRLLGAGVLLSGVRPEMARRIVELGVDLGGIETTADLQGAIGRALRGR